MANEEKRDSKKAADETPIQEVGGKASSPRAGQAEMRGTDASAGASGSRQSASRSGSMERPMGERGPMSQSEGDLWHGVDSTAGQARGREQRGAQGQGQWSGRPGQAGWNMDIDPREMASQAREQGSRVMSQAREQAMNMLDERKFQAAEGLNGLAQAFRASSDNLRQQNQEKIADYSDWAASRAESLASFLRDQDLGSMVDRAASVARRQPELFIGGAFLLGFLGVRFLKSSSSGRDRSMEYSFRTGEAHMPGLWGGRRSRQEGFWINDRDDIPAAQEVGGTSSQPGGGISQSAPGTATGSTKGQSQTMSGAGRSTQGASGQSEGAWVKDRTDISSPQEVGGRGPSGKPA